MFVLAAQKNDGSEVYYTGRVGEGWVSSNVKEAFGYSEAPLAKLSQFNQFKSLHGYWFHVKQLVGTN